MLTAFATTRARFSEVLTLLRSESTPFVRRRFVAVLLLVLTAAILAPFGPVALKLIVDVFTLSKNSHYLGIGAAVALYALTQWLAPAITHIRGLVYARAERRLVTHISDRFFDHVLRLPHAFHTRSATGGVQQSLENGRQGSEILLHHLVFTVLPVLAQLGTTVWILVRLHQPLFVVLFCAAVICDAAAFALFVMRVSRAAEQAYAADVKVSEVIADSISAQVIIKYFAGERRARRRVREGLNATEEQRIRLARAFAANGLVVSTVFAAFLVASVALSAGEVSAARMSVGEFVLINSYMLQLLQPVEQIGYAVQGLSQGTAMMEKMLALLREQPEKSADVLSSNASHAPRRTLERNVNRTPASLEFRSVGLAYLKDRPAIRDISFRIPAGQTFALVGPSGAGKSTIGTVASRLIEPNTGSLHLDGIAATQITIEDWRCAIGVIPQEGGTFFNDTIGYNIAFGLEGCTQEDIEGAAKLAHLHEFIIGLPQAYDTQMGERGVQLSGGQRQRIAIARAAIKQPRLYICDEGTSSLDSRTEADIMRNLRELSRTATMLMIAHRLSTIVHADKILVMDLVDGAGEIVEEGTHAELLRKNGKYAALWEAQDRTAMSA